MKQRGLAQRLGDRPPRHLADLGEQGLKQAPPPRSPVSSSAARASCGRSWPGRRRRATASAAGSARSRRSRRRARARPAASSSAPRSSRTATAPAGASSSSPKRDEHGRQAVAAAGIGRDDLEARAADLGLQRLGRALGHDPALVDDARRGRRARRPPRGTGWSASRSRRPRARAATTSSHRSDAALRVEAGGRLVEEQDARASARARAPGRAGASCRPSSRRPCGRPRRPGRRARAARRRGGRARASGSPCSVVCRRRCSRPVSSGSSAASWSAAPIASRTWAPSRTMS